jgi:hypothetical protein
MPEDAWLKCQREYFVETTKSEFDVTAKVMNKIIEKYNKKLQDDLIDESPYVAEDLKLTILKARETDGSRQKSGEPGQPDSKA